MQRNKDMKLCREGDNRELSIRKDLHRFPIFLCASWNTRPACREFCCYFNIIFEVMQLFFKLLQRWQSRLGERGLPLHGGGEKARHHECPQWGLLNWSGHLRKEVIGVWGGGILAIFYIQSDISECSETLLGHPAEEDFSVFEFKATIDGVMDANIVFGPSWGWFDWISIWSWKQFAHL